MNYYALHNFRQLMTVSWTGTTRFLLKKKKKEANRKKFRRLRLIYACLIYENLMYL